MNSNHHRVSGRWRNNDSIFGGAGSYPVAASMFRMLFIRLYNKTSHTTQYKHRRYDTVTSSIVLHHVMMCSLQLTNNHRCNTVAEQGKLTYHTLTNHIRKKSIVIRIKEALYRIWCGANRLGDGGVHTLGDNSDFVNPTSQLLLPGGVSPEWIPSAYYWNYIQPLLKEDRRLLQTSHSRLEEQLR